MTEIELGKDELLTAPFVSYNEIMYSRVQVWLDGLFHGAKLHEEVSQEEIPLRREQKQMEIYTPF